METGLILMDNTRSVSILQCRKDDCKPVEDLVVRELGLRIVLLDSRGEENFALVRTILDDPEALIMGLLFTSRLISKPSDVLQLKVQNFLAKVRISDSCEIHEKMADLRPTARLVAGVCGPEESAVGTWQACDLPEIISSYTLTPAVISKAVKTLNEEMHIFRQTGGTHGAALADRKGKLLILAEDVGRHNAVDRVIGKGFEQNIDLPSTFLICSGRLTSDLVLKVAVAQIPVLASISAAVDSGIELADAAGITLLGFVRGTRMNVYTHPDRLAVPTV